MTAVDNSKQPSIDPETLAQLAREVLARLSRDSVGQASQHRSTQSTGSKTNRTAASIDDRVITTSTLSRLPAETAELFVPATAVVTPSARDEARRRGIAINRGAKLAAQKRASHAQAEITDFADPARAEAVAQQLSRRGIAPCGAQIILSDTPARDLYHQCTRHGAVAVMVGSMEEVRRFASELDATVWVLDMKRLNLTAAVNVVAQISRLGQALR